MGDIREKILWWAAKRRLKADRPFVIAIGGAIAKTTTKEMIGQVLKRAYPNEVGVAFGNLNTFLGVPLAVLGIKVDFWTKKITWQWLPILIQAIWRRFFYRLPKRLVLEYGTDKDNDLEALVKQIPPDIGIITIVGPAHLGNYSKLEAMVKDEGWLAEGTKPSGVVFLNSADPYLKEHQERARAKVVVVETPTEDIARNFTLRLAKFLEINQRIVDEVLDNFAAPKHRLNKLKLGSHQVLDDSYNASPLAMEAAFSLLKKLPPRRVAIIGDMLELGKDEENYHREVGKRAREIADVVVGVGTRAKWYQPNYWFADSQSAAKGLFSIIQEGDTLLVKGSRGIKMEKIVEALKHGHS
ncbi:MAG TPA: Mur ligase family protein [Candidatus Saccharimonadales bacterium]|nr:Mur ligase family protein [Candidatus Saccharimonadales bacterium]